MRRLRDELDYGIDAPGLVVGFSLGGFGASIGCVALSLWLSNVSGWTLVAICATGGVAIYAFGMASFMIYESKIGKVRGRTAILDLVTWRGDEQVLDVGCGRGLMLIGAAKRLSTGRATGIDIWQARDQTSNSPEGVLANAAREGVHDRVRVMTADMRHLPFDDRTFDVVLSHWVVHNLEAEADRADAVAEMRRVLKRGGALLLTDISCRDEYVAALGRLEMQMREGLLHPLRNAVLGTVSFGSFRPSTIFAVRPI